MSLQTGGRAIGATSTRSSSASCGQPQRILDAHDADLLALGTDEPHLGDADPVVDAGLSTDGAS